MAKTTKAKTTAKKDNGVVDTKDVTKTESEQQPLLGRLFKWKNYY